MAIIVNLVSVLEMKICTVANWVKEKKKVCRSSVDESKRKFSCGDKNDRT